MITRIIRLELREALQSLRLLGDRSQAAKTQISHLERATEELKRAELDQARAGRLTAQALEQRARAANLAARAQEALKRGARAKQAQLAAQSELALARATEAEAKAQTTAVAAERRREKALDKVDRTQRRARKSANLLQRALQALGVTSLARLLAGLIGVHAVLGELGASARAALAFGDEIKKIETLVGVQPELVAEWRQEILALGPAAGVIPQKLVPALFQISSGGERGAAALKILKDSARAAALGLGEAADIGQLATAAYQAYGEAAFAAVSPVDILGATIRAGQLDTAGLASVMGRVIPIAAALGVSFSELGGFVATFSRLGINAEESITAIRGVLGTVQKPSKGAEEALRGVSLTIDELRRSIDERGLARTLVDLVGIFGDNTEALAEVIPNVRALTGVLGTAGVFGEKFVEISREVGGAVGFIDAEFAKLGDDPAHQLRQLQAEVDALRIKVGDQLVSVLQVNFLPLVRDVLFATSEWVTRNQELLTGLGQVAGAGLSDLVKVLSAATEHWELLGAALIALNWQSVVTGIRAVTAALNANPLIAGGTAVIAGLLMIGHAFELMSERAQRAIEEMTAPTREYRKDLDRVTRAIQSQNEALLQQTMSEFAAEQVEAAVDLSQAWFDVAAAQQNLAEAYERAERARQQGGRSLPLTANREYQQAVRDIERYSAALEDAQRAQGEAATADRTASEALARLRAALDDVAQGTEDTGFHFESLARSLEDVASAWENLTDTLRDDFNIWDQYRKVFDSQADTTRQLESDLKFLSRSIAIHLHQEFQAGRLTLEEYHEGLAKLRYDFFELGREIEDLPVPELEPPNFVEVSPEDLERMGRDVQETFGESLLSATREFSAEFRQELIGVAIDFGQALMAGGEGLTNWLQSNLPRLGQAMGQFLGSALGGAGGEILGGIAGGLVGSVLADLFRSGADEAVARLKVVDNQLHVFAESIEGELGPALEAMAEDIVHTANVILAQFGGVLESAEVGFKIRRGPEEDIVRVFYLGLVREFEDEAAAASFLVAKVVSEGLVAGFTASVQEAVSRGSFESVEELLAAMNFAQSIDDLVASPLERFISSVARDGRVLMTSAAELGISLERAGQAMVVQAQAALDQAAANVLAAGGLDSAVPAWRDLQEQIEIVSQRSVAELEAELRAAAEQALAVAQAEHARGLEFAGSQQTFDEYLSSLSLSDEMTSRLSQRFSELWEEGRSGEEIINVLTREFADLAVALEGLSGEQIRRSIQVFRGEFIGGIFSGLADLAERTGKFQLASDLRAKAEQFEIQMRLLAIRTTVRQAYLEGLITAERAQAFNAWIRTIQAGFNEIMREGGFSDRPGGSAPPEPPPPEPPPPEPPPPEPPPEPPPPDPEPTYQAWTDAALALAQIAGDQAAIANLERERTRERIRHILEEQRAAYEAGRITEAEWHRVQELAAQGILAVDAAPVNALRDSLAALHERGLSPSLVALRRARREWEETRRQIEETARTEAERNAALALADEELARARREALDTLYGEIEALARMAGVELPVEMMDEWTELQYDLARAQTLVALSSQAVIDAFSQLPEGMAAWERWLDFVVSLPGDVAAQHQQQQLQVSHGLSGKTRPGDDTEGRRPGRPDEGPGRPDDDDDRVDEIARLLNRFGDAGTSAAVRNARELVTDRERLVELLEEVGREDEIATALEQFAGARGAFVDDLLEPYSGAGVDAATRQYQTLREGLLETVAALQEVGASTEEWSRFLASGQAALDDFVGDLKSGAVSELEELRDLRSTETERRGELVGRFQQAVARARAGDLGAFGEAAELSRRLRGLTGGLAGGELSGFLAVLEAGNQALVDVEAPDIQRDILGATTEHLDVAREQLGVMRSLEASLATRPLAPVTVSVAPGPGAGAELSVRVTPEPGLREEVGRLRAEIVTLRKSVEQSSKGNAATVSGAVREGTRELKTALRSRRVNT